MRSIVVFGFVSLLLPVPWSAATDGKRKSDQELLQGTWDVMSEEPQPKRKEPRQVVFRGNKLIALKKGKRDGRPGQFRIDPTTSPKSIDMRIGDFWIKGIYRLDGEKLEICTSAGKDRPTDFNVKGKRFHLLLVLRRHKPEKT